VALNSDANLKILATSWMREDLAVLEFALGGAHQIECLDDDGA
jgi:hypothetical protein